MAVTLVKELFEADSATVSSDGASTSLPRRFLVVFDSASYKNLYAACFATAGGVSIPAIGAAYDTNSNFKVRSFSPSWLRGAEGSKVIVAVNYGLPTSNGGVVDPTAAPWERDPVISITPVLQPVERGVDLAGNAVVSTAGVPDANGLRLLEPQRKLVVSFAVQKSGYTPATADALAGTVNSAALTIKSRTMAKWCGRLDRIEHPENVWVNPTTQAQTSYYEVIYEFIWIAANTNKLPAAGVIIDNGSGLATGADMGLKYEARANKGTIQKLTVGGTAKLVPCFTFETDAAGAQKVDYQNRPIMRPASAPMYLDSDGAQLNPTVAAADIRWRVYQVAAEASWTGLQIPT
jgi:hypothetical protein